MRWIVVILIAVTMLLTTVSTAAWAGPDRAVKPEPAVAAPSPDPAVIRQGGDTIADAAPIGVPHTGGGTTVGYTDDYDEVCPYTQSTSPDVVYALTIADPDQAVHVDLLGSAYDTKVYVYDENLNLVACNDDFYPDYTSRIELPDGLSGLFYVVIDGYGGDAGEYVLSIGALIPPVIECPPDAFQEDEPPLVDGYVDAHNGGCDALGDVGTAILQTVGGPDFCGGSGWYERDGEVRGDSDWLVATLPASGVLEIEGDADYATTLEHVGPQDCAEVGVLAAVEIGPYQPATLTVSGDPHATVWLRVAPAAASGPTGDYTYLLIMPEVVATEAATWSEIKSLY